MHRWSCGLLPYDADGLESDMEFTVEEDALDAKEYRRGKVLASAAARLGSAAFDWRKGLTFDLLCTDTGLDRKTISKDFGSKKKLMSDLIGYCLNPDNFDSFGEPWADDLLEAAETALLTDSVDMADSIGEVGRIDFEYVRSDNRLRSQLAIWGLALDDEDAQTALRQMYRFYDSQHLTREAPQNRRCAPSRESWAGHAASPLGFVSPPISDKADSATIDVWTASGSKAVRIARPVYKKSQDGWYVD